MKAMVLTGIRQMEMREVPTPEIHHPSEVLVRMGAVGVCGSDVHYYTTGRIGSQVVSYPFAVGHECAGTVAAVGSGVTSLKPGDPVAIEPAMTCGACDQCLAGRANTCRNITFLGCPGQAEGSLSEYIVMPERCCLPMQEGTALELGTISEPLAIGIYAVKRSILASGGSVGILGTGPIGLSVLLSALHTGARRVFCTDKIDSRLRVAACCGASWTGNPDSQDVVADILAVAGKGLDVVFECCGQQDAIDQAVELLRPGGQLMLIGIPEVDRVSFQIDRLRRKELDVRNVRRQEGCAHEALRMIESGELDVAPMVTHHFAFSQTQEAFDLVASYGDGVVKAMINFD